MCIENAIDMLLIFVLLRYTWYSDYNQGFDSFEILYYKDMERKICRQTYMFLSCKYIDFNR